MMAVLLRWSLGHKLVITPMRGRGRKQNWVKEEVELQFRPDKGELRAKDCVSELFSVGLKCSSLSTLSGLSCPGPGMTWGKATPEETDTGRLPVDEAGRLM